MSGIEAVWRVRAGAEGPGSHLPPLGTGGYAFSDVYPSQYVVRKLNLSSWDLIDQEQAVCNSLTW
jgi:hypothetical protein